MRLSDFNQYIREYIESRGIDTKGMFSCIVPHGSDSKPSAHIYQERMVKCFGCGVVSDIFDVAHHLEGLPSRKDPKFFTGNVAVLAKRFGITVPTSSLSYSQIYNEIVALCKPVSLHPSFDEWNKYGIISCQSPGYDSLINDLNEKFDPTKVISAYLGRTSLNDSLFRANNTTLFPLWDAKEVCIGFMVRNNDYELTNEAKYIHSSNNGLFNKPDYVYGLHLPGPGKGEKVYIVEGIKDVYAGRHYGLPAYTTLGTSVSYEQIDTLKRLNSPIVVLMDEDVAGWNGRKRAVLNGINRGVVLEVGFMKGGKDLFEYMEKNESKPPEIVTINGLKWLIDFEHEHERSVENIIKEDIIPVIASSSHPLFRSSVMKMLAELYSLRLEDLREELESYIEKKKKEELLKIDGAVNSILEKSVSSEEKIDALEELITRTKSKQLESKSFNNDEFIGILSDSIQGSGDDSQNDILLPMRGLGWFTQALHQGGLGYTKGRMIVVPGDPHAGKTAFIIQFVVELLAADPNTMVCFFTTDDSIEVLLPRILSCMAGTKTFTIDDAFKPVMGARKTIQERLHQRIQLLASTERLIIKDTRFSPSIQPFLEMVSRYRKKYPDRKIIVANDNFHRNSDFEELGENAAIAKSAKLIKSAAVTDKFLYIGSAEYRKQKEKGNTRSAAGDLVPGSNSDIKGATALQYFMDVAVHLNNDFAEQAGDASKCLLVYNDYGDIGPRIMCTLSKNKITGRLLTKYMDLYPNSSLFYSVDQNEALDQIEERRQHLIQTGIIQVKNKGDKK